ncbi:MAG: right-handed parallel beta-helix repeat-containing protein [Solirubrobacteraceae bacterium]
MPPAAISGVTYYVSPNGSDQNPGTSPALAWRTVGRVNSATLAPGDGVLFQGGATFSDTTLMPEDGGSAGAPIVFGSYGSGQATITQGVWFASLDYLTFDNLRLGPDAGFQGGSYSQTASHITIQRCTISLSADNSRVGITSSGDDWTIADNTIEQIGNSGMLLNGDGYLITGNTIDQIGLDPAVTWPKHGIYLDASDATITDNTITNFQSSGISARYRNSTITGNYISGGEFGITFFQYDPLAATSHWTGNSILNTTVASVYVDGGGGGLMPTHESFVITSNTLAPAPGSQTLSLEPTSGTYQTGDNSIG